MAERVQHRNARPAPASGPQATNYGHAVAVPSVDSLRLHSVLLSAGEAPFLSHLIIFFTHERVIDL